MPPPARHYLSGRDLDQVRKCRGRGKPWSCPWPISAWPRMRTFRLCRAYEYAALGERQPDAETRATAGAILDFDGTTDAADKVPGDGKAEAGARAIAISRSFQTQERLEDPLAFACRHAGPAIIDQHDGVGSDLRQRDCRLASVFHRIVQEVADDARERRRLAPDLDRGRWQVARDRMASGA